MKFSQIDDAKAAEIARRLAQIVPNGDGQIFGERVLLAIQENKPNASTVTGAMLLYGGNDRTNDKTRDSVRDLLKAYRDQLMAIEQMECQENLAQSNEKLGQRMLFVAWAGVAVAIVGAAAALVQIVHG
jgi:hypothetical protein